MKAINSLRAALPLGSVLLSLACAGPPPPQTARPSRPLDERRALELISQAFREEHDHPVAGRDMPISQTRHLHVDVASDGHKYGVAYVTHPERIALANMLPKRDPALEDALQLVSGVGTEDDARVLVLQNYDYSIEQAGQAYEAGGSTAELKLKRDVRDFLVRAHTEKWP